MHANKGARNVSLPHCGKAGCFLFQAPPCCICHTKIHTRYVKEFLMEQKDLEYFKQLLTEMLDEALKQGEMTLEDMTDNNENCADPADRATVESDRSFTLRIRDRERQLIKKIKGALTRIDDGVYGVCEECGEDIGVLRLKARPVTKLCINCKSRQEADEHLRGD